MPFDNTRTPGQREAGDDGVEPLRESIALALGKHPGEEARVTGECVKLGTLGQYRHEPLLFEKCSRMPLIRQA
ncbi:hypothetical protein [Streptomyces sp. SID5789]|uniref:hypothetical protein n=1 Tax=Streptomyces sp. SID5789 TaxID=2690310 RepID=UPI00136C5414|nr:hypothetical protein [Streptomyces sp. SID5789]MZE75198.1 hypothetical protein [Streptomyces sp. SID5789]